MSLSSDILVPLRELSHLLLQFRAKLYDTLDLIVLSLALFVLLNLLLYYLIHKVAADEGHEGKFRLFRRTKLPEKISRTLIVTAHPGELDKFRKCTSFHIVCDSFYLIQYADDECMFFGPTLIALKKRKNCKTYLLCLSNGELSFDNIT